MMPFVSCICPTYNRCPDYQWLVEEAVESFLRQDYPADRRELIVLSDAPGQELIPPSGVTVQMKWPRVSSLGEKYNYGIAVSRGDLICPWEDDDISLPWRISQAVKMIDASDRWTCKDGRWVVIRGDAPLDDFDDYWKPPQVIYWDLCGSP